MKKVFAITTASLALAAVAVEFSPSIGVTQIGLSQKNNIIPVQFTSLAVSGVANVTADALVCTNNIPVNSHLYVYDATGYKAWVLEAGGWSGLSISGTASADGITYSGDATEKTLDVGTAIWLSFPETPKSEVSVCVYGKVATATNVTITAGSKAEPKTYLLCNPKSGDVAMASILSGTFAPSTGDVIKPLGASFTGEYTYSGKYKETDYGWVKKTAGGTETNVTLPTLSSCQGFWYVSKGGSGTICW